MLPHYAYHRLLFAACLYAPTIFTLADKRDIFREAVFLCRTPFDTPRINSGCASLNAVCAATLSPEAIAVSTRFKKVRMRLILLLLISPRFALRRIRFLADLWFAIRSIFPIRSDSTRLIR